jgi:nucleoside-diphosphate-sugar epimerase
MLAHIADIYGPQWSDHVTLFGSSARSHLAPDGTSIAIRRLDELSAADIDDAVVIHLAYLTKEKAELLGERAFVDSNLAIDDHLFDALRDGRPKTLFVASSGAAAMAEKGYERHPYGLCKLRQEDRFLGWSAKTGVAALAGRIFNLAGPYINKIESYAIGSFASQARRTGEIRIAAQVPIFRSFLHVDDLCALVLGAALTGSGRPSAIDLCGAEVLEMGDIAATVAAHAGSGIRVAREPVNWSQPSTYLGNFVETKLLAMELGASLAPFNQQVIDTLAWMDSLIGDTDSCQNGSGLRLS